MVQSPTYQLGRSWECWHSQDARMLSLPFMLHVSQECNQSIGHGSNGKSMLIT